MTTTLTRSGRRTEEDTRFPNDDGTEEVRLIRRYDGEVTDVIYWTRLADGSFKVSTRANFEAVAR